MSMYKKILFLILFPILCSAETVSVIVPCYYKHFYLIPELLNAISRQTKLPDDVVISVSESEKIDKAQVEKIIHTKYNFDVKFIFHKERLYAGENRNSACENAIGDILISQDADDLPHPQRIEILTNIFQMYPNVQHIIHKWAQDISSSELVFFFDNIKKKLVSNWKEYSSFKMVHNGNCAIRRNVFKTIRWSNKPKAQDVAFNQQVIEIFAQTMVIDAELLIYRNRLSSWR